MMDTHMKESAFEQRKYAESMQKAQKTFEEEARALRDQIVILECRNDELRQIEKELNQKLKAVKS